MFVDRGVINLIYAIEPPAPPNWFHFCLKTEAFTALTVGFITLKFEGETRQRIFEIIGGKPLFEVSTLTILAGVCVILGTLVIFGGALIGFKCRDNDCIKGKKRDYFQQHVHE